MTHSYLIGADPEVFVVDDHGVFVNGHGLIPGSKDQPFLVHKGAVQVDGMALEFNIDPAATRQEFLDNMAAVQIELNNMIGPKGLRIVNRSVMHIEPNYFRRQPRASKRMGCDPDFDAWNQCVNDPPPSRRPMRTAAGHVHIGWGSDFDVFDPAHMEECARRVRHLDCTVGLWTLEADPDSHERRVMYGRAGAFRPKPYGLEYRVPSNFWIQDRVGEMYDRVISSMQQYDRGDVLDDPQAAAKINHSSQGDAHAA